MSVSARLLQQFRERHPTGTLVADLVRYDAGVYTVRAEVRIDRQWVLGSGMAVHADLETAEERAMERALWIAGFGSKPTELALGDPAEYVYEANGHLPLFEPEPVAATNGNGSAPRPTSPAPPQPAFDLEAPVDLSDLLAQTDVHLQRIGWTAKEGKDYLQRTFGKTSRQQLSLEELQAFLRFLKGQPNHIPRRPSNPQAPF